MKSLLYIADYASVVLGLSACGDDETYDFPGDAYNRAYMPDQSGEYEIIQTPVSTVSNLESKIVLKCTQKAASTIKATIEVDNTLIADYNKKNGTEYEELSCPMHWHWKTLR